jgi:hypothetical protein
MHCAILPLSFAASLALGCALALAQTRGGSPGGGAASSGGASANAGAAAGATGGTALSSIGPSRSRGKRRQHRGGIRLAHERRPVRQAMSLARLPQMRDPQPRVRVGARAAAAPAFRAPDRLPDVEDVELVGEALERFDRDLAAVIADWAREEEREVKRSDLAEQHRRERIATHPASVSRGCGTNNVLSYAPEFLPYAEPALAIS